MVFYFVSNVVSPPVTLFMGRDKFENEDLIKWGWLEDVWFHVDKVSSAHVYLRLKEGQTLDDVPSLIIDDAAQLVKANSKSGNKLNDVNVIYTMWSNLKKTPGMEPGQVAFNNNQEVRTVNVSRRINEIVNRLTKTKREEFPDLRVDREKRDARDNEQKRKLQKELKEKEKENERQKREEAELRSYTSLMKPENMTSNQDDDNFLLRFLRSKKFSLLIAQEQLLKYLNLRQTFSKYCYQLDCNERRTIELINRGFLFVSPFKDANGRRVTISLTSRFDPYKFNSIDMGRAYAITLESLLTDEDTQVLGVAHFGDVKGTTAAHVTMWSPTEFARGIKWGEQSLPMRHKEIHIINIPSPLKYVYDLVKTGLTRKIKDRINIYDSLEDVHKKLDRKILPKEYGGVMPISEMIDLWKKELMEKRESIMNLDKMKLLDNSCIMKKNENNNTCKKHIDFNLQGSFRKLELD